MLGRTRNRLSRRDFLRVGTAAAAATATAGLAAAPAAAAADAGFTDTDRNGLVEVTIAELQARMRSGKLTARELVEQYLERIGAIDRHGPRVNSVLEVNPDARAIADALDRE